jgi:hypothetical protein
VNVQDRETRISRSQPQRRYGEAPSEQSHACAKSSPANQANLDHLIEQMTVAAYGEDEQLCAFRQAFEKSVAVPCDAMAFCEAAQWLSPTAKETSAVE